MTGGSDPDRLDWPPRDADKYSETDHYRGDCLQDPMRFVTHEMVRAAVEDGRDFPTEGGPGNIRRRKDYDGVDAVVVLDTDDPTIVSAWTEVGRWPAALASDRWTYGQLQTIRAFQDREHKGGMRQ